MISFQLVPDQERIVAARDLAPCFPKSVVELRSQRALWSLGPEFSSVPRGVVVFGSLTRGGLLQGRIRTMLWGLLRRGGGAIRWPRVLGRDHYLTFPDGRKLYRGGGRCLIPVWSFCTRDRSGVVLEHCRPDGRLIWLAGEWGRQSEHGRTFRVFGGASDEGRVPRIPLVLDPRNIDAWCDPRTRSDAAAVLAREPGPDEFCAIKHREWPLPPSVLPASSPS